VGRPKRKHISKDGSAETEDPDRFPLSEQPRWDR